MFSCNPDDPKIVDMDPWLRLWHYECWVADQEREFEVGRALAILIGSFTDPKAAREMLKKDNPDISASDSEEEAFDKLHAQIREEESVSKAPKRRRRKFKME